eukprot:161476_1
MSLNLQNGNSTMKLTSNNQCICGKYLIKTHSSKVYGGKGIVTCDSCDTACTNCILWHCDANDMHLQGFDICDNCIEKEKSFTDNNSDKRIKTQTWIEEIQTKKLLLKILQNILSHPTDLKYRDLKYDKIKSKFSKLNQYKASINILFFVGFRPSINQKRLIWRENDDNLKRLQQIIDTIKTDKACCPPEYETDNKDKFIPNPKFDIAKISNKPHNSKYLLHPSNVDTRHDLNRCVLSGCLCLKMIGDVLQLYKRRTRHTYNHVDIINDFNHLLYRHSNEFEQIHDILTRRIYSNEACELSKCLFMKRNQRDRAIISTHEYLLNKLYCTKDAHEIVSQQFLDRIHCFYFHSFDTAYKLTNKEKESILNEDVKTNNNDTNNECDVNILQINEIVKTKQNNCKDIKGLNRL